MGVTSYLALYTTLLGWQQYQNLWQIMTATGLVYLPFIGIVVGSCITPFTSMGAKDAAQIALRRLTINVVLGLFVIAFACVPTIPLDPDVLHFTPVCQQNAQTATPGHTGTTYDNAFDVPTGVKVPILWYLVMSVSNGFTHAANLGLSCTPINYRALHEQLNLARIHEPALKQQVIRFYNECYVPAKSTYMSNNLSSAQQAAIKPYIDKYGVDDVNWLGSNTFVNVPGFYDAHSAKSPVAGFAFDPSRDAQEGQVAGHSQYGEPSCKDWWLADGHGLFAQLTAALPKTVTDGINKIGGSNASDLNSTAVKTLIQLSFDRKLLAKARGYESLEDSMSGDVITRFLGEPIGIGMAALSGYPKIHLLINALPLMQGSLLFALYVFLAIAIPFASYRLSFLVTVMIMLFSLIFCSYIWHLVAWFDNHMIEALFPSAFHLPGMAGVLADSPTHTDYEKFVNMVISTLYVVLPLLWLTLMSWAGFKVGAAVGGMVGSMSAPAEASGSAAGSVATTAVSKVASVSSGGGSSVSAASSTAREITLR